MADLEKDWLMGTRNPVTGEQSTGGGARPSGWSMAAAGDLDGNGVDDIIVGTPSGRVVDGNNRLRGEAWIFLLSVGVDGVLADTVVSLTAPDLDRVDMFGISVAGIGDIDSNGVPDLAVGAIGDDESSQDEDPAEYSNRGAVYIFLMGRGPDNRIPGGQCQVGRVCATSTVKISDHTAPALALKPGDFFGTSVVGLGNRQIAVGVPKLKDSSNGGAKGIIYVIRLDNNANYVDHQTITATEVILEVEGDHDPPIMGMYMAAAGDADADGNEDLVVGVPTEDASQVNNRGAVYVLFLNQDGSLKGVGKVSSDEDAGGGFPAGKAWTPEGNSYFGKSVATIGRDNGRMLAATEVFPVDSQTRGAAINMLQLA